jgi:hypothetical protein
MQEAMVAILARMDALQTGLHTVQSQMPSKRVQHFISLMEEHVSKRNGALEAPRPSPLTPRIDDAAANGINRPWPPSRKAKSPLRGQQVKPILSARRQTSGPGGADQNAVFVAVASETALSPRSASPRVGSPAAVRGGENRQRGAQSPPKRSTTPGKSSARVLPISDRSANCHGDGK